MISHQTMRHQRLSTEPRGSRRLVGKGWPISPNLSWSTSEVAAGELLYREGAIADRVCTVKSGVVKLVTHLPSGRVRILGLHGPGAVLGLTMKEASDERYSHTAIALEPVEAAWLTTSQLHQLRGQRADEYLDLVERHCHELAQAQRWITEFSAATSTCRIARVIRYLAELQNHDGDDQVELLTCQEMADVIGVSAESASRVLAKFKRLGVLRPLDEPGARRYRFDSTAIDGIAAE